MNKNNKIITFLTSREIVFYKDGGNQVKVEVLLQNENFWLTQAKIAELFGVQKAAVSKHLKNIFEDGELLEEVVVSKMETTTRHGVIEDKTQSHLTNFYNLDAIIAVGYRVNSKKSHDVPNLGKQDSQRIHHQRLCDERRPP